MTPPVSKAILVLSSCKYIHIPCPAQLDWHSNLPSLLDGFCGRTQINLPVRIPPWQFTSPHLPQILRMLLHWSLPRLAVAFCHFSLVLSQTYTKCDPLKKCKSPDNPMACTESYPRRKRRMLTEAVKLVPRIPLWANLSRST